MISFVGGDPGRVVVWCESFLLKKIHKIETQTLRFGRFGGHMFRWDFSVEAVQVVFYVKKYLMGNVRTPGAPLMPVAFKQPRGYAHFPFQNILW